MRAWRRRRRGGGSKSNTSYSNCYTASLLDVKDDGTAQGALADGKEGDTLGMGRWRTLAMTTTMWVWMQLVTQERKSEVLEQARNQLSGLHQVVRDV
jgi:hypothetical protein